MLFQASEEKSETDEGHQHTPLTMIIPPAVLVAGAVVVGLLPHLGAVVQDAAVRFQDQTAYNQAVLFGRHVALADPIRRFQSGVVNDYVTWIVIGVACIGGVLAITIR